MQKNNQFCIVGIDYFRVSYPDGSGSVDAFLHEGYTSLLINGDRSRTTTLARVVEVLERFGYGGWAASAAHHGYRFAMQDAGKAITVYSCNAGNEDGAGVLVQAAGAACSALGAAGSRNLIAALYSALGGWLTRIDINVDFTGGTGANVIDQAGRSYHKGQFGKITSFEPFEKYNGQELVNHGCGIGDRSSDKYIRIYDKGLESGDKPRGEHVRWETELKGDKARQFGWEVLVTAGSSLQGDAELSRFLASYALGEGRVAKRLPSGKYRLVRWYADLLRMAHASVLTVPSVKQPKDYGRKVRWYSCVVAPWLKAVGAEFDQSPGTVLDSLALVGPDRVGDPDDPVFAMGVDHFRKYLREVGGAF